MELERVCGVIGQRRSVIADTIVQCVTNLARLDIFLAPKHWFGKPVIAINMACVWHAMRACGINGRISGRGRLLEAH